MVVRRWSGQDDYRGALEQYARLEAVPLPLAYAIVAQESGFRPDAIRQEPQIGDASYGLMQILSRTARGLGYTGAAAGLLDPETNLQWGMKALGAALRQGRSWPNAASGYNGGFRPELGFGSPAKSAVTICSKRNSSGACTAYSTVQPGMYGNPEYVAGVLEKAGYFAQYLEARDGSPQPKPPGPGPATAGGGSAAGALGYLVGGGLLIWLIRWAFKNS